MISSKEKDLLGSVHSLKVYLLSSDFSGLTLKGSATWLKAQHVLQLHWVLVSGSFCQWKKTFMSVCVIADSSWGRKVVFIQESKWKYYIMSSCEQQEPKKKTIDKTFCHLCQGGFFPVVNSHCGVNISDRHSVSSFLVF